MAITYVGVGASTNAFALDVPKAVPVPAGTAAGDILVLFAETVANGSGGVFLLPSGWTEITNIKFTANNNSGGFQFFWRLATSSEPASYNLTITSTNSDGAASIAAWRGVNTSTPINVSAKRETNVTGTPFSLPDITTTVANTLHVGVGFDFNGNDRTHTAGGSATLRFSNLAKSYCHFGVQDEAIASAGAVTGKTMAANTAGNYYGVSIALAPVAAAPSAPTFTTQPANATVSSGATATFGAVATDGSPAPTLQWQHAASTGAFSDVSGATGTSLVTGATTVTGGTWNNGDRVQCIATNSQGSATSTVVTLTVNAVSDVTLPTLTGTVTVGAVTASSIAFSWPAGADNVAVTSYEVSCDTGTPSYTNTGNTALSATASSLSAATTYTIRVRARDAAGNVSTPAITVSQATSSSADATAPTLTGTLTGSAITQTTATLTWPAGADNVAVAGYDYSINGGTSYTSLGNVLTVGLTGLTASTTYPTRVRARDAAGNVSTPVLSYALTTSAAATGTITGDAIKNNTGTLLTALVIPKVAYIRLSDMVSVLTLASQTTNGSGLLPITNAALVTGVAYIRLLSDATGANIGAKVFTAT